MDMTNVKPGDTLEIALDELADLPEGSYLLIDTRDEISYTYGTLEGAVNFPDIIGADTSGQLPKDRKLVLFCMHGNESYGAVQELRRRGYEAYSLHDGYGAYLREQTARQADRSLTAGRSSFPPSAGPSSSMSSSNPATTSRSASPAARTPC